MSHLPPCPHTSVPLFLLSVILGLLAALPRQEWFPAPGSDWMQCGQRLRWAQPLAPLGQCCIALNSLALANWLVVNWGYLHWTRASYEPVIHHKKIVALLFRGCCPCSSHLWHSDLGSWDLGFRLPLSSTIGSHRAAVHTQAFLIFHPFQQCCALHRSHSSPPGSLPAPCFFPLCGLRGWDSDTATSGCNGRIGWWEQQPREKTHVGE